ncbi:MAG TPA: small ribosomal subunit Rsm22 family protein [Nitrospira sp.]|nr:small ribosomal subunit Rsm22 family protein [Nitrospira sp.]
MPVPKGKQAASVSPVILHAIHLVGGRLSSQANHIARSVEHLSRLFTKERKSLAPDYMDDSGHAAAYLSYFMAVNLSKIQVLLDELPAETLYAGQRTGLRVLDVGSGPGTGALAVLDWLHQKNLEDAQRLSVTAVDSSSEALQQAKDLWSVYCREAGIQGAGMTPCERNIERCSVESWGDRIRAESPFDLIIAANCLNELFAVAADPIASRAKLIAELLDVLAPHGTLMVVEPALRETSRALHEVRDRLVWEKRCTVYSPCLHEQNCPALIDPDDWCHEERPWQLPAHIREIDEEVGFIKDALKFSYLLLRKDGRTMVPRDPHTFRVVSELRELKGDTRAWVCNELGRSEIGRLDKVQSETNAPWSECQRGTIVRIEGLKRRDNASLVRIPDDGSVRIVRTI